MIIQNRTDLLDVHEALAGVQHDVQQDEPGLAVRLLPLLRRGAVNAAMHKWLHLLLLCQIVFYNSPLSVNFIFLLLVVSA